MANPFDRFDATDTGNPFDQFDSVSENKLKLGSPEEKVQTAKLRKEFIKTGTLGTRVKEAVLDAARNPKEFFTGPTDPATGVVDFATRVAPESAGKLPFRAALAAYEGVKGQVDPLINALTDTSGTRHDVGGEMRSSAADTLKSVLDFVTSRTGLQGLDKAREGFISDPAGTVAALKGGNEVVARGGRGIVENIANTSLPEKLVASGLKMPKGQKWAATASPEALSRREQAIQGVMGDKLPLSPEGADIARNLRDAEGTSIGEIAKQLDETHGPIGISRITKGGERATFLRLVDAVEKATGKKFGTQVEGPPKTDSMGAETRTLEKGFTPSELQELKVIFSQTPDYLRTTPLRGLTARAQEGAFKSAANVARRTLEGLSSEIRPANRKWAAYNAAADAIDRAVNRTADNNIVPLGLKASGMPSLMLGKGYAAANILGEILGIPSAKVAIGNWLNQFADTPTGINLGGDVTPLPPFAPYDVTNNPSMPRVPLDLPPGAPSVFDILTGANIPTRNSGAMLGNNALPIPEPTFFDPTIGARIKRK